MTKPCGLITMIAPALQREWTERLAEFIARFKPAALILQGPSSDAWADLIAKAREVELAVLFIDAIHKTRELDASGVYLSTPGSGIANVRRELGPTAIIGAACGLSRHFAMESAEASADFVAFDASSPQSMIDAADLTAWWDDITGVPSALYCLSERPDRTLVAKACADFLILLESEQPAESLTFATEFGLQSQS